ncbi:MAG: hypothetical protein WD688_25510 [Candidatus Binatia bacterium]
MPRHPRVHAEELLYHVMARGNDGQKIISGGKVITKRFWIRSAGP